MTPESDWVIWAVIAVGGLLTYGLRASFVFFVGDVEAFPPRLERSLRFVPAAVLAALVAPAMFVVDGQLLLNPLNERIVAAGVAVLVAYVSENVFATIGVGMAVFWGLRFLV